MSSSTLVMKADRHAAASAGALRQQVASGRGGRVLLVDSITQVAPEDAGSIVVCASHGGASSARYALAVPLAAVFFNDAGVGKDGAGIAALGMLQQRGIAAGAVSHMTARIGDARDMWDNGEIAHLNAAAAGLGLARGDRLRNALCALVAR